MSSLEFYPMQFLIKCLYPDALNSTSKANLKCGVGLDIKEILRSQKKDWIISNFAKNAISFITCVILLFIFNRRF